MKNEEHGAVERLERVIAGLNAQLTEQFDLSTKLAARELAALSRIASLETALKERTAELKIATGALQADGRFAETVKVLTDVLDEYDSEEG